jgi:spore maturation protein CgeE
MIKLNRIIDMEIRYASMFSDILKTKFGNITKDDRQSDKYYHNYLHVLNRQLLINDVSSYLSLQYEKGFANYRIEHQIPLTKLKHILPYSVQMNGYFAQMIDQLIIPVKRKIVVRKVKEDQADQFFEFLFEDNKIYGVPYALGNVRRQREVIFSYPNYGYYEVIEDDHVIGHVNVFIDGNDAKIDDFVIRDSYQKKGYGSALMAHVINELKALHIRHVYLVCDMMDTPKNMYHAWGFEHIGDYLFIHKKTNNLKENNDELSSISTND